jgi:hypothetical protein
MHLRAPDIDRYLRRDLDERTQTVVDAQVSVCLPWTQLVAHRAMEQAGWERRGFLGRLIRVERRGDNAAHTPLPERNPGALEDASRPI